MASERRPKFVFRNAQSDVTFRQVNFLFAYKYVISISGVGHEVIRCVGDLQATTCSERF